MTAQRGAQLVFVAFSVLLLTLQVAFAGAAIECLDSATGETTLKNLTEYQTCGTSCSCSMYEVLCLERLDEFNFTLHHRSPQFAIDNPAPNPDILCNIETAVTILNETYHFSDLSAIVLKDEHYLGEKTLIPLPSYQELSSKLPGSYEDELLEQLQREEDDDRDFWHPFREETTKEDLLRRIVVSETADWDTFIQDCYDPANNPPPLEYVPPPAEETQDEEASDEGGNRRLQDTNSTTEDAATEADTEPEPVVEVIPPYTLVCDLHYYKSWNFRRRFEMGCGEVTKYTRPCDGTHACICKHSESTYYRLSKTMPIVPEFYPGLQTALADAWTIEESNDLLAVTQEEDEGMSTTEIAIIAGGGAVGGLVLCCVCYYVIICCAKRAHKVTYLDDDKKNDKKNRLGDIEMPNRVDRQEDTSSKLSQNNNNNNNPRGGDQDGHRPPSDINSSGSISKRKQIENSRDLSRQPLPQTHGTNDSNRSLSHSQRSKQQAMSDNSMTRKKRRSKVKQQVQDKVETADLGETSPEVKSAQAANQAQAGQDPAESGFQ